MFLVQVFRGYSTSPQRMSHDAEAIKYAREASRLGDVTKVRIYAGDNGNWEYRETWENGALAVAEALPAASGDPVAEDAAEDSDGEDDGEWTEEQERDFLAAVEASDRWSLGDNGYMDTVLVCETCGRDNEYSDRAAAASGVAEDECRHCSPEAFSAYGFTLDTDDCEAYERGDDPVIVLICDACDARYPYADMGAAIDGREDGCGACGRT